MLAILQLSKSTSHFLNHDFACSYNDYYENDAGLETDQWLQNRQNSQKHQVGERFLFISMFLQTKESTN